MENITISGCNGTSSVIVLQPNCSRERIRETSILSNVRFMSNAVYEDAHLVEANVSCSELEITDLVLQENKCTDTDCVLLGRRNVLRNVYLRSNKGSNDTSLESTVFSSHEVSETLIVNMTSKENWMGSIHVVNGTMSVTNSHFRDNTATLAAAIMFNATPSAHIDHCTFARNSGRGRTGGVLRALRSNVIISFSVFRQNNAFDGQSISFYGGCNSSIVNSTFENNTSQYERGAILAHFSASLLLSNSSFIGDEMMIASPTTLITLFDVGLCRQFWTVGRSFTCILYFKHFNS